MYGYTLVAARAAFRCFQEFTAFNVRGISLEFLPLLYLFRNVSRINLIIRLEIRIYQLFFPLFYGNFRHVIHRFRLIDCGGIRMVTGRIKCSTRYFLWLALLFHHILLYFIIFILFDYYLILII